MCVKCGESIYDYRKPWWRQEMKKNPNYLPFVLEIHRAAVEIWDALTFIWRHCNATPFNSDVGLMYLSPGHNTITFYSDGNGRLHGNRSFRGLFSAVCGVVMGVTYYCRIEQITAFAIMPPYMLVIQKTTNAPPLYSADVSTFNLKTANKIWFWRHHWHSVVVLHIISFMAFS